MPVDLYIGGSEHAVLHLLYARFWHKVLYDIGVVSTPEPFKKLVHQGIVLGEDNQKMSKSRGNVVNPDEIMDQFGADAVRLYEMFMGPLEAVKPWSTRGVEGVTRFLERAWRLMVNEEGRLSNAVVGTAPTLEHQRLLHQTIKKVTEDIEGLRFNTAISQMMVFTNEMTKAEQRSRALLEPFVLLLAPFAPHLAEELWEVLGHQPSVSQQPWPIFDPAMTVSDRLTIPIQVNGKLRAKLEVGADATREQVEGTGSCADRGVAAGQGAEEDCVCREKADELCRLGTWRVLRPEARYACDSKREGVCLFLSQHSRLSLCLSFALLGGCGYQFRVEGAGPTIGGAAATSSATAPPPRLVVRTLENKSFEPNLETRYTNYLRHEFSSGSGAQVVPEAEAADLVLTGQILSVSLPTLSFTQTTTLESRAEVIVIDQGGGDQDETSRVGANGEGCLGILCDAGSTIQPCPAEPGAWNKPVVSSPRIWLPAFCSSWNRGSWPSRQRVPHRTTRT